MLFLLPLTTTDMDFQLLKLRILKACNRAELIQVFDVRKVFAFDLKMLKTCNMRRNCEGTKYMIQKI